jgi:hypothetical protein
MNDERKTKSVCRSALIVPRSSFQTAQTKSPGSPGLFTGAAG